jgi:hypothetical protein
MNYYMGTYHTPQNPRSTESSRPYKENGIKKSGKFGLEQCLECVLRRAGTLLAIAHP